MPLCLGKMPEPQTLVSKPRAQNRQRSPTRMFPAFLASFELQVNGYADREFYFYAWRTAQAETTGYTVGVSRPSQAGRESLQRMRYFFSSPKKPTEKKATQPLGPFATSRATRGAWLRRRSKHLGCAANKFGPTFRRRLCSSDQPQRVGRELGFWAQARASSRVGI